MPRWTSREAARFQEAPAARQWCFQAAPAASALDPLWDRHFSLAALREVTVASGLVPSQTDTGLQWRRARCTSPDARNPVRGAPAADSATAPGLRGASHLKRSYGLRRRRLKGRQIWDGWRPSPRPTPTPTSREATALNRGGTGGETAGLPTLHGNPTGTRQQRPRRFIRREELGQGMG